MAAAEEVVVVQGRGGREVGPKAVFLLFSQQELPGPAAESAGRGGGGRGNCPARVGPNGPAEGARPEAGGRGARVSRAPSGWLR